MKRTILFLFLFSSACLNSFANSASTHTSKKHIIITLNFKSAGKHMRLEALSRAILYLAKEMSDERDSVSVAASKEEVFYKTEKTVGRDIIFRIKNADRQKMVYEVSVKEKNKNSIMIFDAFYNKICLIFTSKAFKFSSEVKYRYISSISLPEIDILSKAIAYRSKNYKFSVKLLHYLLAKKPTFNYIRPLLLNILFENYSYPSCIKNAKTMLSLPSVLKNKYVAAKIKLIQAQCYLKTYNADKALILLKECENFYKKTNKKLLLIKSLVLKAKVLTRLKKYADSIKTADTISSILKADYPKIISLLTKARTMFYMKEKVKEAEANFEKAFTFFKEAKSEYHLIRTGVDLAAVKIRLKKYSEANKIIASTEKLLKNKKTPLDLLAALSFSKAFILFNAQKYALALEHFLIAVSYSLKTGNSRIYGKSRFYAGVCLLRGKKYKEALKEFFSVIKVARKKGFININGWALFYLHYSYYMLKDHKKSLAYLEGAIEVLGDINHESLSYLRKRYKLLKNKKKLPEVFEKPVKRRERALNSTAAR